ncbi:MAG: DUF4254 domain-containing protein [Chitinophagaceae bacterium]
MISENCNRIFQKSIEAYHLTDDVNTAIQNPFPANTIDHLLYLKNWIDTVQWHLEDIIRNPNIDAADALKMKRLIDASNQERTDVVEYIDNWFLQKYKNAKPLLNATTNTESPAWAIDRLSILALKIYHMQMESDRKDAGEEHKISAKEKLHTLLAQRKDLSFAIDQLIEDIAQGRKYMKVYKQMKMYNDENLNPVLYHQKNK